MTIDRHLAYPNQAVPLVDEKNIVTKPWRQFFMELWRRTGSALGDTRSGFIGQWAGTGVPDGYLLCDGKAVSRNTYADLFAAIDTTWGAGDGSLTFNVPNLVDYFLRGAVAAGESGGSDEFTLTVDQLPSHSHVLDDPGHTHTNVVTDPGHSHTAPVAASNVTAGAVAGGITAGVTSTDVTGVTVAIASAVTGITLEDTGGGAAIPLVPKFASVVIVIKT